MKDKICIVACIKHEELYVKEWLDFHINCGIDHFFLCDNNETDYQYPLIDVIKEYVDKGIVDVLDYSSYEFVQPYCYNDLWHDERTNEYDWMLIIDIDEFICIPKHNDDIKAFLRTIPDTIDGLSFPWKYYGDNGLIEYDDRPVMERFPNPANNSRIYDGQSLIIKSMIRTKHNFGGRKVPYGISSQHMLSPEIKRYDANFNRISGKSRINVPEGTDLSKPYEYLQELYKTFYIKHYFSKTIEEYVRFKMNRTVSIKVESIGDRPYYELSNFFGINERTEERMNKAKEILESLCQKET